MMGNPDPWDHCEVTPSGRPVSPRLAPALEVLAAAPELSDEEACFRMVRDSAVPLRVAAVSAYRLRCVGEGRRGECCGARRVAALVDGTVTWWTRGTRGNALRHLQETHAVQRAYDAHDQVVLAAELGRWLVAVCDAIAAGGIASEEV